MSESRRSFLSLSAAVFGAVLSGFQVPAFSFLHQVTTPRENRDDGAIIFDDVAIATPLLHGEFYPMVTVRTLRRGRRIEGVNVRLP